MKKIEVLLEEYGLDIDDLRWHLSVAQAEALLAMQMEPRKLTEEIWSGRLESSLFHMEERLLDTWEVDLQSRPTEEARIRSELALVRKTRRNRWIGKE